MANLKFNVSTEGEVATAAPGTAKTVLQAAAPSNQRVDCRKVSCGFDGTNPSAEACVVELLRQTTGGTMTSGTPVKQSAGAETIQTTCSKNATAEPTAGDVLKRWEHHPAAGTFVEAFDRGELEMPGGTRLGLRVTVPSSGVALNCIAAFDLEE